MNQKFIKYFLEANVQVQLPGNCYVL